MRTTAKLILAAIAAIAAIQNLYAADKPDATSPRLEAKEDCRVGYARELLKKAGKTDACELVVDPALKHEEAFSITAKDAKHVIVTGGSPAGVLYGVQALLDGDFEPGKLQIPDFGIRGTTLPLMYGDSRYLSTLSPSTFPWFYDKPFVTRTLDTFASARLNTIFLWAGHLFPYIVEMPKYPEAAGDISPEQLKANQEQFRWFVAECQRRNIRVLLHFYNIHVSTPFAKKHGIRHKAVEPTPLLRDYVHYALTRYFKEFPSVGLYICPGETLRQKYQLEWFRDVIFDAAKKSGKNPLIVIRDWTLDMEFRNQLKSLYDNLYTELKHNDESFSSPYPDVRHLQLKGIAKAHVINVHGPPMDLQPMRWASPATIQEAARNWKSLGFVSGIEFYGESFWKWPYTLDKVAADDPGAVVRKFDVEKKFCRLISLDRDAPYYAAFGRYLWKADRNPAGEQEYWARYMTKRYGSEKIGKLIARWYVVNGPINPGIQNLNANRVANFFGTALLINQRLDQILNNNKRLDETPCTLHKATGSAKMRYYPRPFDDYFFERYRKEYGVPKPGDVVPMYKEFEPYKASLGVKDLEQRHCMPVSQYAEYLEKGKEVTVALTPDKVIRLLNKLSRESLALAREAEAAARDEAQKKELHRFVTDSEMHVLATETMIHKENAAILKARILISKSKAKVPEFLKEMEESVAAYQRLAEHAQSIYYSADDLARHNWNTTGTREFNEDLAAQRKWAASLK